MLLIPFHSLRSSAIRAESNRSTPEPVGPLTASGLIHAPDHSSPHSAIDDDDHLLTAGTGAAAIAASDDPHNVSLSVASSNAAVTAGAHTSLIPDGMHAHDSIPSSPVIGGAASASAGGVGSTPLKGSPPHDHHGLTNTSPPKPAPITVPDAYTAEWEEFKAHSFGPIEHDLDALRKTIESYLTIGEHIGSYRFDSIRIASQSRAFTRGLCGAESTTARDDRSPLIARALQLDTDAIAIVTGLNRR